MQPLNYQLNVNPLESTHYHYYWQVAITDCRDPLFFSSATVIPSRKKKREVGVSGGGVCCKIANRRYRISLNRSRTLINSRPRIGRLVALLLNLLTRAPRIGRAHPPIVQS